MAPFSEQTLQALCGVLGRTDGGLTGGAIAQLLRECQVQDLSPSLTKRHRLFNALSAQQAADRHGDGVVAFITAAMAPVRYLGTPEIFDQRRIDLNGVLSFAGLNVGEDGSLSPVEPARTLAEAQERAGRLRHDLEIRRVHPDVLRFCQAELLEENYFHAVFEATKKRR